jgi:hypothetical protein
MSWTVMLHMPIHENLCLPGFWYKNAVLEYLKHRNFSACYTYRGAMHITFKIQGLTLAAFTHNPLIASLLPSSLVNSFDIRSCFSLQYMPQHNTNYFLSTDWNFRTNCFCCAEKFEFCLCTCNANDVRRIPTFTLRCTGLCCFLLCYTLIPRCAMHFIIRKCINRMTLLVVYWIIVTMEPGDNQSSIRVQNF